MNNKINAVTKAVTLLLATASAAANANLVITEYIEGSGSNKAVEITNLGDSEINLDAAKYELSLYANGDTEPGNSATLTGILAAGSSIVYHNSDADDAFKVGFESEVTYFNGDDALVLSKDGSPIDRLGKVGERPSGGWTDVNDSHFSTTNKTLRRKETVITGDTNISGDFPGDNNQWVTFDVNTADGLGCPGEGACVVPPGVLLITEYIEGSGNNKAVEISNVGGDVIDLDAAEYNVHLYINGAVDPSNSEKLTGQLDAGESIVFHNSSAADEFKIGTSSSVTNFNGDDALVLWKDDEVIDRIGKVGEDPGSAWTDPTDENFSTANKTLRRKSSVIIGDSDANADFPGENNQWLVFEQDTADGLGCMGEEACSELPPADPEPETPCSGCEELTPVADPNTFDSNVYYSDVLNGNFDDPQAMKNAISIAISEHQQLTYKQVWTALSYSDEDPQNNSNVIELYTGASVSKQNNGGNVDDWNREHVWAKSHGFPGESQLGYTDAHHLRPTNVQVNSTRSNYDFNNCRDTGVEVAGAPGNYVDGSVRCFEPRDEVKGDVARMIMYMDTRYQGNDNNMPDLVVVDRITTAEEISANEPLHGKLCALYAWHQNDPVDETDMQRNDAVYKYQGNRNPYIDYPDWVQHVYGAECGDPVLPTLEVDMIIDAPAQVNETEAFVVDASATVLEGADLSFSWMQVSGPEVEFDSTQSRLSLMAPEVEADTQFVFALTVSDGALEKTQYVTIAVINVPFIVDVNFSGNTELQEGESTTIVANIADEPAGLYYSWRQVSGTTALYTANGLELNVTAPEVSVDHAMTFELVISDGKEQVTQPVSIHVSNAPQQGWSAPESAGSLGATLFMLVPLLWRRRHQW
ncbi:endonuclease [Vibrio rarus]|uniref:endonuclease n=1 Tax=Vibrio rarus TaxID=413403 RepID=UPI0021C27343|nr:endonuclease [Vibrio rarus]